jgi:hypothetical protein
MVKSFGEQAVYWACTSMIIVWGIISFGLKEIGPRRPRVG